MDVPTIRSTAHTYMYPLKRFFDQQMSFYAGTTIRFFVDDVLQQRGSPVPEKAWHYCLFVQFGTQDRLLNSAGRVTFDLCIERLEQ